MSKKPFDLINDNILISTTAYGFSKKKSNYKSFNELENKLKKISFYNLYIGDTYGSYDNRNKIINVIKTNINKTA